MGRRAPWPGAAVSSSGTSRYASRGDLDGSASVSVISSRKAWAASIRARQAAGASAGSRSSSLAEQGGRALRAARRRSAPRRAWTTSADRSTSRSRGRARVGEQLQRLLVVVDAASSGPPTRQRVVAGPDAWRAGRCRGRGPAGRAGPARRRCRRRGPSRSAAANRVVQPDPLAGQQVVVDRLAEQGVAEGVALAVGRRGRSSRPPGAGRRRARRRRGRTPRRAGRGRPCGRRRSPRGPPGGRRRRAGRAGPAARRRGRPGPSGRARRRRSSSSSTKNALPSARSTMSTVSAMASPSGASSAIRAGRRRRRAARARAVVRRGCRDHSATWRRSGWRRWRSSAR